MTRDNRHFSGSASIRIGAKRVKLEFSPAELHGGEQALFRIRVDRRWHNHQDGGPLYFDRSGLAELVSALIFDEQLPALPEAPLLPRNSRASVTFWHNDSPHCEGVWTATPPIRGHDGRFYIGAMTVTAGFIFIPVDDVTILDMRHAKQRR